MQTFAFYFRYSAVCHPFSYRESARPANANKRVFKYVFCVTFFSCTVNMPRFFETEIVTKRFSTTSGNSTETLTRISFDVTDLRRDPDYIR